MGPIGTLLLWGSWWRGARVSPGRCRSFAGCAGPAAQATLVLDGQQRVQALLNASAPDSRYVWDAVTGTFFVGEANPMCGLIPARWLFERNYRELQEMYTFCDTSERVAKKVEVLYQNGPRKGWSRAGQTATRP